MNDPRLISRQISLVISKKQSKQPVDEGCAYLYGGSWLCGKEIFKAFKEQIASNKIQIVTERKHYFFFKTEYPNQTDYINVHYWLRK
jgi:hypothetical protein